MRKFIVLLLAAALVISLASCININVNPETTKAEPTTTAEEITTAEETETGTETETKEATTETETGTETETEEATTEAETEKESERYVYEGVSLILPEGFSVQSAQGVTLAVYEDYPTHSDNISFVAANDSYETYTEENLKQSFTQAFGSIENFKYENSENDDYKTVTTDFDVTYNGVAKHEKACTFFFSGKCVVVTFTSVSGEFDAAFEQTLQSVQIVK